MTTPLHYTKMDMIALRFIRLQVAKGPFFAHAAESAYELAHAMFAASAHFNREKMDLMDMIALETMDGYLRREGEGKSSFYDPQEAAWSAYMIAIVVMKGREAFFEKASLVKSVTEQEG